MESNVPNDGLSNKIKVPIIILTLVTLVALGALFVKLAKTASAPPETEDRALHLRAVGDRLRNAGLIEQAIDQYVRFLNQAETDRITRAEVAHAVGELYMELSNCREALAWLFQAETAGSLYPRFNELKQQIDTCTTQLNSPRPKNLTAR